MKYLLPLLTAACLSLTSCLGSEEPAEQSIAYTYANNFTYVTTYDDPEGIVTDGAVYKFTYDVTNHKCRIDITGLRLAHDQSAISMSIPDVTYAQSPIDGVVSMTLNGYRAEDGNTISNLDVRFRIETLDSSTSAGYYQISYTVNGRYNVRTIASNNIFRPVTVMAYPDGVTERLTQPYYTYALNYNKRTARLIVNYLNISGLTATSVTFDEIPYTINASGLHIAADDVTAKVVGATGDDVYANTFKADITFATTFSMQLVSPKFTLTTAAK